jgi:RNA recognition motif-containing protein
MYRIENLRNFFGQYGPIGSIYYPVDLKSKKYLTFAFIRFLNEDDAHKAQSSLDNTPLGE